MCFFTVAGGGQAPRGGGRQGGERSGQKEGQGQGPEEWCWREGEGGGKGEGRGIDQGNGRNKHGWLEFFLFFSFFLVVFSLFLFLLISCLWTTMNHNLRHTQSEFIIGKAKWPATDGCSPHWREVPSTASLRPKSQISFNRSVWEWTRRMWCFILYFWSKPLVYRYGPHCHYYQE